MFADNPLADYPRVRKALYLAFWLINGLIGLLGIVLVALGHSPAWLIAVTSGFNFASSYLFRVSGKNVTTPEDDEQLEGDPGDDLVIDEPAEDA